MFVTVLYSKANNFTWLLHTHGSYNILCKHLRHQACNPVHPTLEIARLGNAERHKDTIDSCVCASRVYIILCC